jgi:hypothetical protein
MEFARRSGFELMARVWSWESEGIGGEVVGC